MLRNRQWLTRFSPTRLRAGVARTVVRALVISLVPANLVIAGFFGTAPAANAAAWPTGTAAPVGVNFTSCGTSGPVGPTLSACTTAATGALTITGATHSGSTNTYTTSAANNFSVGETVTISGITSSPASALNLTSVAITSIVSPTQFTVASAVSGTYTSGGTVTPTAAPSWISSPTSYNVVNGIQYWTVPQTGTYSITAVGASGASAYSATSSAYAAKATGNVTLYQGQVIKVLVGQTPNNFSSYYNPGGGGTFVATTDNTPLVVAGGAGGSYTSYTTGQSPTAPVATSLVGGATVTTPGVGSDNSTVSSTTGGLGGNSALFPTYGYLGLAGGGFNTDAQFSLNSAFINGGSPLQAAPVTYYGGFGGGGSVGPYAAGGGGGYTGGNGGYLNGAAGTYGGGGGSFIASTATSPTVSNVSAYGNGYVSISLVGSAVTTNPTNSAIPTFSGAATIGSALTATNQGGWTGATSFTYTWLECSSNTPLSQCQVAPGTTGSTISFTPDYHADNKYVILAVTATSSAGTSSVAYSAALGPMNEGALFTTCGTSGSTGPTASACTSAYSTANTNQAIGGALLSSAPSGVNTYSGYQYWTVPVTGTYHVVAVGGSSNTLSTNNINGSGMAANAAGDITLNQGEILKILVGQAPNDSANAYFGGGGGTFVAKVDNTPLVVAGGAGATYYSGLANATTTLTTLASGTYSGASVTQPGGSSVYSACSANGYGSNITASGSKQLETPVA